MKFALHANANAIGLHDKLSSKSQLRRTRRWNKR